MRPVDLHPLVRSFICYERVLHTGPLVAADARFFFVSSGGVRLTLADGEVRLPVGACAFIPAGHPYAISTDSARLIAVAFEPFATVDTPESVSTPVCPTEEKSAAVASLTPPPFHAPFVLEEFDSERELLHALVHTFRAGTPFARAHVSARFTPILLRAAELCDEQALPSRLVEHLDSYIREHMDEDISNTELGAMFGYHPFYISQLLKKKRGITLHQYILSYKLSTAADQLRYTDRSVADIAASLGFADPSYFTKSFKSVYGATPKDYRKLHAVSLI